jgi:ABC-type dipeptide/oligopeptide/nickel transport systems, permease components
LSAIAERDKQLSSSGLDIPRILRLIWSSYYVRQAAKALFTIFFVTTLIFFLVRLMPSNPVERFVVDLMYSQGLSRQDALDQARAIFAIDLDAPMYVQYIDYLGNLLKGDLGVSLLSRGTPVIEIIKAVLPWTIFSVGTGLMISFTLGILIGTIIAYRRESLIDPHCHRSFLFSQCDPRLFASHSDHCFFGCADQDQR